MSAHFRAPLPWHELFRRTVLDGFYDGCPRLAAPLAFFVLPVFPALLFLVRLAGLPAHRAGARARRGTAPRCGPGGGPDPAGFSLSGFAVLVGAELNAEIGQAIPEHDDQATAAAEGRKKRIRPDGRKGWRRAVTTGRSGAHPLSLAAGQRMTTAQAMRFPAPPAGFVW
jgi:hypothetical protein